MAKLQGFLDLAPDEVIFIKPINQNWGFWSTELDDQEINYRSWDITCVSGNSTRELGFLEIEIAKPIFED